MVSLSLCIIAKNEEDFIQSCISCVKDMIDEVILVDTGSIDKTKEKARQICSDVKIFDFEWCDDFAAAKNFAIRKATSDWIFVLDADEVVEKQDIEKIKEIIQDTSYVAFAFTSRHYTTEKIHANWHMIKNAERKDFMQGFLGYYDVNHITRLFLNDENLYFQGKVHEDINPSIFEYDKKVGNKKCKVLKIPIHHLHIKKKGSFIDGKQKYYYKLSKEKLQEHPDSKIALDVAVGSVLFDNDVESSLNYLVKVLEIDGVDGVLVEKIIKLIDGGDFINALRLVFDNFVFKKHDLNSVLNLAKSLNRINKVKEALVVLKRIYMLNPQNTIVLEYLGVCLSRMGKIKESIIVFERALELESFDKKKAMFCFNLGALYEKVNELNRSINYYEKAINFGFKNGDQLKGRINLLRLELSKKG